MRVTEMENESGKVVSDQGSRRRAPRRKTRGLMQDKRGRWWIDYRTPEGRRRRKLCGTHDSAKTELAKVDLSKKDRSYIDPHASPTFQEFSEVYLKTVSVHKKSHERVTRLIKSLVAAFGSSKLAKVKRSDVLSYRVSRMNSVSKTTVNREVSLLRHIFNVAVFQGMVGVNPARGGPDMTKFHEEPRKRYLEMAEIETLLLAIQARIAKNSSDGLRASAKKSWQYLHTAVVMALHTGMRKGEILGLRWINVNWERRTLLLEGTKNGESRRVPMDSILVRELSEHRTRIKDSELVFPSYDLDGDEVPLADVKNSFGRALKDASISNFRFHDLRHTFASHYMMSGGQLYTLSKILGHKDIKMTQRYAELSAHFIDRERERMDTIWTPAGSTDATTEPQSTAKYIQ
jgi:integrase